MNCQEVQLQLSGYLEKSLDAIRMKGVEAHLASCPFCRAEARGLSDCIALVADLPSLEPPAGFAQRVLAHAREFEIEPRLWQRLRGVLGSTAPIQTTAVLLIGVLAVLMYQKEPRLRDGSITELTPPPPAMRPERQTNTVADSAAKIAGESAGDLRAERRSRTRPESTPAPTASARAPAKAEAPETEAKAAAQSIPDSRPDRLSEIPITAPRRPIQAQEVSTGREPARPSSDVFGLGAGIGALNRQPFVGAPFSGGRALSPLSEPSADFEFIVRRRALERREADRGDDLQNRGETAAAIASAAAQRSVPAPAAPSSSIVEIRWFTVAPHHFEEFRKELAAEANIDSEKAIAVAEKELPAKSSRDPLLVKVIILPSER
jgi:hypothetical protein